MAKNLSWSSRVSHSYYCCCCLLLVLTHPALTAEFCAQFFQDIKSRVAYNFTVNDTSPEGTIVFEFERPPIPEMHMFLTSPDTRYINMDYREYKLVVRENLKEKNGQMLQLNGTCQGYLEPVNVKYEVELMINVHVNDVNNHPRFINLPTNIDVYENFTVGGVLFNVLVDQSSDLSEAFRTHHFNIEQVTGLETSRRSPTRTFYIDEAGDVRLLEELDYEQGPRIYKVQISVKDEGDPPLSNTTYLVIYVLDVDDMPPKFSREIYQAEVIGEKPLDGREECFNATEVIVARDQDRLQKSNITYEITDGEPGTEYYWGQFFRLEEKTGMLCQRKMIQRLLRDADTGRDVFYNFTFTIKASQVDNPDKYDTSRVFVHVVDANQYAPSFTAKLYRSTIKEFPMISADADVLRVTAHDFDHGQNSKFIYELLSNPEDAFAIDPHSGAITVKRPEEIDREKHEFFEFRVRAKELYSIDRLQDVARVLIQIMDVNDNRPVFSNDTYSYTIMDSLKSGMPVHEFTDRPRAYDTDAHDNGRVEYRITGVWRGGGEQTLFADLGRFSVDSDTGAIRLAGTLQDLRRKRDYPLFHLKLTASDKASKEDERLSSSANVFIQVVQANQHPPTFFKAVGPHVASDQSNRDFPVAENAPIGTVVAMLPATDEDGDEDVFLDYRIVHGNERELFRINSNGWIVLRNQLDREVEDSFGVTIEVTDGKHNVSTNVTVHVTDVNDNEPQFDLEEYDFRLQEDASVGTLVGQLSATDKDLGPDGLVSYSIKPGDSGDTFEITQEGEILVARQSSLLDREQNAKLEIKVIATDSGEYPLKSTCEVTVHLDDVNDNRPVFAHPVYTGSVREDDQDPRSQRVNLDIAINATDRDASATNRDVRYRLEGEGSEKFGIDPVTASVTVLTPGSLNSEAKNRYDLKIIATDQGGHGFASTADLIITVIDVNDNAPQFSGTTSFHHDDVTASLSIGSRAGYVTATDNDVTNPNNHVIYVLKKGGYGKFSVDLDTGEILVSDHMDREPALEKYQLQIEALDGGVPRQKNSTVVTISVPASRPPFRLDPSLTFKVKEDIAEDTWIGDIPVYGAQDSERLSSLEGLEFFTKPGLKVPFKVIQDNGKIFSTGEIDYETATEYEFIVYVRDVTKPSMTANVTVTVEVDDVNDNAPVFLLPRYEGTVLEDDQNPQPNQIVHMVLNISATDRDKREENRGVILSLHGDGSDLFTLDPGSGQLRVSLSGQGKMDREQREKYSLMVRATDQRGRGLSSEVPVTIYVLDRNDNSPLFVEVPGRLLIEDPVRVGDVIGRVMAHDADASAPNNEILYILDSDSYGKFKVDVTTGQLSVLSGLFYKPRQKTYLLQVTAMDKGSPTRASTKTVSIRVKRLAVNDFKPEFLGETIFHTREEVAVGTVVGTLTTIDGDELDTISGGERPSLTIESEKPVPFLIDSETGEVRTTSRLDFDEGQRVFTFGVVARDRAQPPTETRTSVGVILRDINDNPPLFTQSTYRHRVADNFPPGTTVATPFAYDQVDSEQSFYTYSLDGDGAGEYFLIDPNNGVVTTTEALTNVVTDMMEYGLLARDKRDPSMVAVARLIIDISHSKGPDMCSLPTK